MADIFLSYSRQDRAVAASIAEILPKHGWTLYWDRQLLAGEVFDDALEREINAAKCVIVLWSSASIASQWVRNEAGEGANRNLLVSVRIEDVKLPLAFRRIQAADLISWRGDPNDERLIELVHAVSATVGRRAEPTTERFAATASASAPPTAIAAWPHGPPSGQWLSDLKRDLAGYLGPFASVLVDRELRDSRSIEELLDKVGGEIPNESERKQFLRSRRPLDNVPADVMSGELAFKPRATVQTDLVEAKRDTREGRTTEDLGPAQQQADGLRDKSAGHEQAAASLQKGREAIAVGQPAEAVQEMVASAALLASEKLEKARIPGVTSAAAWSPRAKAMATAAALVALLGGGWLVRSLSSNKSLGDLRVSPASIVWTAGKSGVPPASEIRVEGGQFAFEVTSRNPWIEIQPSRGTAPASVTIARKGNPGETGSMDGEVFVRRLDGTGQAKTIPVHLSVQATPTSLLINPATLSFVYQARSESYPSVQVNVTSQAGPRRFSVRVTKGMDWLAVKPSGGSTPALLSVNYHNPSGAAAAVGDYVGELACETEDGQLSLIPVNLTVRNGARTAPLRVDGAVMAASLIRKVVPVYPELARLARVQGSVEFTAVIGKDGSIQNLQLVSGHPLLVKAAQDAVVEFRYKPTLLKGKPVEVTTDITVNFALKRSDP